MAMSLLMWINRICSSEKKEPGLLVVGVAGGIYFYLYSPPTRHMKYWISLSCIYFIWSFMIKIHINFSHEPNWPDLLTSGQNLFYYWTLEQLKMLPSDRSIMNDNLFICLMLHILGVMSNVKRVGEPPLMICTSHTLCPIIVYVGCCLLCIVVRWWIWTSCFYLSALSSCAPFSWIAWHIK